MSESIKTQELVAVIAGRLKKIEEYTNSSACCEAVVSAGVGNIPSGFASVSLAQIGSGSVVITMPDSSTYTLANDGEVFVQSAPNNKNLPAYSISGSATWKWIGIK